MVEIENNDYLKYENNQSPSVKIHIQSENVNDLTLTWQHINVILPEQKEGGLASKLCGGKTEITPQKSIIQNVEGIAKPGELLAIMGASGAGKTTLLNVLTFRNNGILRGSGEVKVNGKLIKNAGELSSISGYVQQDDIFIGTLKVKEHLKFQAMLRMSGLSSTGDRNRRVNEVLRDLNLEKCKETLIGNPQLGIKGISGGERRRLAFASEIITNPALLFCDEPTSGLDSFMAMSIVESMRDLAQMGKTIICTIHQPSSEIFDKFDSLYLMAEGRLAYSGSLNNAFDFFASQDYKCPPNYNPADFYINKLAISPFDKEKSRETIKKICDGYNSSTYSDNLKKDISVSIQSNAAVLFETNSSCKTNSFNQLRWLMWRDSLAMIRNPMDTKIAIIQNIVIAILFGLIYLQLDLDQKGVQNINGVLFLLVTNSSFSNMFPVINSFQPLLPLFLRENKNGMYRVINFYMSKFFVDLPKFVLIPLIFTTIVYWMAGLNNDVDKFFITCVTIILVSNCAVSLGTFLSAAAPSLNIALALAAPILVPLMIFSGFFLNNNSVPVYFVWFKYLSWLSYSNEILVINQWNNIDYIECGANATMCYNNGHDVMNFLGVKEDNLQLNFIWMGCLIVGWRVLAFFALLAKSYKK